MRDPDATDEHPAPPPAVDDLLAITPDDWAWLLGVIRTGLHALDDAEVTAEIERLRASPASRLAGGRMRQRLAAVLSRPGPAWQAVADALSSAEVPSSLAWLRTGEAPPHRSGARPAGVPGRARPGRPASPSGADPDLVRRLKERARTLLTERDDARRRAEGAEARVEALDLKLSELAGELDRERARTAELEDRLRAAEDDRAQAIDRERRRGESRLAELEDELREVRRRDETRRQERARQERARQVAEEEARQQQAERQRSRGRARPTVSPGRPTVLPRGIAPGTRDEAAALLGPDRRLLVDGYNVTLTHRKDLTLEEQREWLVRQLSSLAARRRVRPTVVFDGRGGGGGGRPADGARKVSVVFTPSGVTADDEITLAVQATDEPLVVVTDDRGLRDRVRPHGVDLLGTQQFLWIAG